jgi:hypothetical protein
MIKINYLQLREALVEAWPIGLMLAVTAGCWGLAYVRAANLSEQILYSGTALQVVGLLTVAIGISDLRRLFGLSPILKVITEWVLKVLRSFNQPVPVNGTIMSAQCAGTSSITAAMLSTSTKMTIKMRVAKLEKSLNELRELHDKGICDLQGNLSRVELLVQEEGNKRQSGDSEISSRLKSVAVGGIHLEMVGLVWLLLGVLGTSIPKELSKLF